MSHNALSLLTTKEAAAALRIGRTLLYSLMDTGQLRYLKIGRARRIDLEDIREFLRVHRIGGVA